MLKWEGMNHQPTGIAAALARAWRAVVTAFTPMRHRGDPHADGTDTTLFDHLPERSRTSGARQEGKHDDWDGGGESTDFSDADQHQRKRR